MANGFVLGRRNNPPGGEVGSCNGYIKQRNVGDV